MASQRMGAVLYDMVMTIAESQPDAYPMETHEDERASHMLFKRY